MKIFIPIILTILIVSCNPKKSAFNEVECFPEMKKSHDSIKIYKPCRQFIYRAKYWDEDYNLISDQRIWMMNTGKTWKFSDNQVEVTIQYEYDESEIDFINGYNINSSYDNTQWVKSTGEGFIENDSLIFFHPFRFNQYIFTEVAPFPQIKPKDLSVGASWEGTLNIHGWGDWDNSTLKMNYLIVELATIQTEFQILDSCWHISSVCNAPFGKSTHNYWFNKQYGFVKMVYKNYKNQLLSFELIDVVEN